MLVAIYDLIESHDPGLLALAVAICVLAAFATITLLGHTARAKNRSRWQWLAVSAVSAGTGVWATHFVAMLAFSPGFELGFDFALTIVSLGIAIAVIGGGFMLALSSPKWTDSATGGALAGLGISLMHFTGMASIEVGGALQWNVQSVALSIIFGIVLGAASVVTALHAPARIARFGGATMFVLAICAMHFTAMSAAGFENCYAILTPDVTRDAFLLPLGTALATFAVLGAAIAALYLDRLAQRRTINEAQRLRGLANASIEGLLLCEDGVIVTANSVIAAMFGRTSDELVGMPLTELFPADVISRVTDEPGIPLEADIEIAEHNILPAEIVFRFVETETSRQYAIAVRDLRAKRQSEQRIRFLAHYDALTGLPNRASFTARLEYKITQARTHRTRVAVLSLNIDRFKQINEDHGHETGDAVIAQVGAHLNRIISGGQFAARFSSDEFALILPDITSTAAAGRLADQLLASLAGDDALRIDNARLSASIGIAIFPDNAADSTELINNADMALQRAKREEPGSYRFFSEELGAEVRDKRLLERDLRNAIERDELYLTYQPQVNLRSHEITGFEVLLRWKHPERGEVSPAIFVPLAEQSNLIVKIGDWVLEKACAEAAKWSNPLRIAVNVSAMQLHYSQFLPRLEEILWFTGLSASRLELEITETALIEDMTHALKVLGEIKDMGISIAMDDFGTGYSSLYNLRAFPFDKIKIDQSFVRNVQASKQSAAIVRAMIGLGRGLDLPVLAEGVEHVEELEFLDFERCAEAQGFLFGWPLPIAEYENFTSAPNARYPDWPQPVTNDDAGNVITMQRVPL